MYVERDIEEKFGSVSLLYNIVAVVGPRQAGKTTFLKERMKGLNASYVMLDDPDARGLFDDDIKKFESQYIEGHEVAVLDEVQYGKDAGRKLKYLADKGRKIWITSSSQTIMSKEVLSWLVGRVTLVRLYPFSFGEFLRAKKQKETTPAIAKRNVWEHLVYGSYPKVVLTESVEMKQTLLKDLYSTMVLKDIAQTFSIGDIRSLEELCRYLSHSVGNVLVYEKAASGMKVSFQTIKKYLDAMEKSYLIVLLQPFYTNKLKEVVKQPKVYFVDTGLRNAITNSFPLTLEKEGKLFENYVLGEMLKLDLNVKYWQTKTGVEVDFVVEKDAGVIPVEAKISASPEKIEKNLRSFIEAYKPKLAFVVFYEGVPGEVDINGCRVVFTDVLGFSRMMKSR